MCGLVGVAGNVDKLAKKAFEQLLVVDQIRGPHSTGACFIAQNDSHDVVKGVGGALDLIDTGPYERAFRKVNRAILGHNRWATVGKVNKTNAHPFEVGGVVGMHNGTLINQALLPDSEEFEVDSENIIHAIDKVGLKETVANLHGAYALSWYEGGCIHFIRNKERPLNYCYSSDRKTLFWASESWMLHAILSRCAIKYDKVLAFKEHQHYKFSIQGPIGKPVVSLLEPYTPPPRVTRAVDPLVGKYVGVTKATLHQGVNPYYLFRTETGDDLKAFSTKGSQTLLHNQKYRIKVTWYNEVGDMYIGALTTLIIDDGQVVDRAGKVMTEGEFLMKTKGGCGWCCDVVEYSEGHKVEWLNDGDFFCPSCALQSELRQYV